MSETYFDGGPKREDYKVMLATPSYASPDAIYTYSMSRSREALHQAGIQTAYLLLVGNCHVDDSRNTIVKEFLQSDCDDLVFLDADVSWQPEGLAHLCSYRDEPLVGGVYPYRREGVDTMPYRGIAGVEPTNGLLEVEGLPTGFLKIKREVIENLCKGAKTFKRKGETVHILFERDILGDGRRGGDIHFCMNAVDAGYTPKAVVDLRLGHAGRVVIRDSLAAVLRRQNGATLQYMVDRIRAGEETPDDYQDAYKFIDNVWAANDECLMIAVAAARRAEGPVIEAGSGLSTVLLAAATDQPVYCLEHNPYFADQTVAMVQAVGLTNVFMVRCKIVDGWYDIDLVMDQLPDEFALGFNDGPPRQIGDRMKFFDVLGDRISFILSDDADDAAYADKMKAWAAEKGKEIVFPESRSAVIRSKK